MKISISSFVCLALVASFWLAGCSDNSTGSNPQTPPQPLKYGDRLLKDLPALSDDYRPESLSFKVFQSEGKVFAPANFQYQSLTMTFDVGNRSFRGESLIHFRTTDKGRPFFQLDGTITSARLNGETVEVESISDPDGLNNKYVSISKELPASQYAVLEIEYAEPTGKFGWESGGLAFLTDMTDLSPGRFFETWAPVGFEDDSFSLNLKLRIENSELTHQLFSNGRITRLSTHEWAVSFPEHFTASSFYVHLTLRPLVVREFVVQGLERNIPVLVYSSDATLADKAAEKLPALFSELEIDFGPYAHPSFVAYIHPGGGGMEYSGATITSLSALGHELFHSWFARGVMPAEGRSGWIDEALASWRDNGYFQASSLLQRPPTVLASFSPFRRSTPSNCYKDGRQMIAELDRLLAESGGMKKLMRAFYERYRHRLVTTEEFAKFLELKTGVFVSPFFDRYIYGHGQSSATSRNSAQEASEQGPFLQLHPAPLTMEDAQALR